MTKIFTQDLQIMYDLRLFIVLMVVNIYTTAFLCIY